MRRTGAKMNLERLLTVAAVLTCLALAAPAAATDTGGGVAVPVAEPAPTVEAAQEETPTTPEGEEQPPEEQPNGEQPPSEEPPPVDEPEEAPSPEAGEETGASLPRTGSGIELAALSAIGLGLLLAGAALWPTRSWPPPRDRLSRSTTRR